MHPNVGKLRTRVAEKLAKSDQSLHGLQSNTVFCWCYVCLLLTLQNKNCEPAVVGNIVRDHKRNKNAVACIGWLNFPVVNKSVIAKVKKVDIDLGASL